MLQRSFGRLVIALVAFLSLASSPALAQSPAAQRGLTFVRVHCAQCHAVDKVSDSPLTIAPPFRTLHLKFPIESLRRRLAEGIVADHPTMPQIPARSGSARGCDGISADIRALMPSWRNPAPAPFREPLHPPENRLEFDLDQDRRFASAQQCRRERSFVRNPRPIRGGCDARVFTATKAPVATQRVRAIVAALDGEAGRSAARNRPPGLR
jgi:mono/diheme cytochrome c family protein